MKKRFCLLVVLSGVLVCGSPRAETLVFPEEEWEPAPSPLASEWAEPGGRYRAFAAQYPRSFNYYLDMNVFSGRLFGHLFESLLQRNPLTLDYEPGLAERVVVSEDRLTYTVHLHPEARWSDGKPVSADDVLWTFEAVMDDEHLSAGAHKVMLSKFEPPEKLDERTVRFRATEVHWRNMMALGGLYVLPKHWWERQEDFNRVNFEFPVMSGPYRIARLNEPSSVLLERREDYWAADDPRLEGLGNFDELEYRFYSDRGVALDNFLQGQFDVHAVYTARYWVNRARGERFEKNWIVKQRVYNRQPQGFQGFAMNMRRPLFQDVRVRRALAHLLDRERLNATLMYNQYALTRSYFEDLYPEENPHELIAFDVDEARRLLGEAGWKADNEGVLRKDGRRFQISFLTRDDTAERFLMIYREALEEVGIRLRIDRKDWAAWSVDMQEFNFDMTWAAWGAGLFKDPESMWHSRQADVPNSSNITGFQNGEVDQLIESISEEFDVDKRHEVVREIDAILVEEVPYVLLWNSDHTRLLYWNKFDMPDHVLGKYGTEGSSEAYWWLDLDMEADLEAAREQGRSLPGRPYRVDFDEVFDVGSRAAEPLN